MPAALVAALFLAAGHGLEDWLWSDPHWYLVLGLPMVGACVVLAARALLPGDGGHDPLEGIGGIALATLPVAWFDVSPTLAVAVSAAAGMAAMTGLLLTSMLFATLLVGRQGLDAVPAAVLAAAAAWLAMQALERQSDTASTGATR